MDLTDINDAYAMRVNPMGATPVGGDTSTPLSSIPPPPAMTTNTDPVVFLPPISNNPVSTNPVYPESVVSNALRSQQASSTHGSYSGSSAPYVDASSLAPPPADDEPGYFERMGLRRRDVMKLVVLSVMVALGISIHWVGSHYITEWIESSDFDAKQRLAIRISYPAIIVFAIWNLKAFQ